MISKLFDYFLDAYAKSDYVLQQKSRVVFSICIVVLIVFPVLAVINAVRGTSLDVQMPLIIGFILMAAVLALLRRGHFSVSAHLMMVVVLLASWGTLWFDDDPSAIVVIDTIVFIPALMVLTPFIIVRRRAVILLYTAANVAVFIAFALYARDRFKLSDDVLLDYMADSMIAMIVVGLLVYFIHRINTNAVDKAEHECGINEKQFHVIRDLHGSIVDTSERLSVYTRDLTAEAESFSLESQNQASSIEEITATSEEVSVGIDLAAESVGKQYGSMNFLTGDIGELSGTINSISERINHTLGLTGDVSNLASRGGTLLTAMSQSLSTVNESSGMMTGIVGMIGDISDRTNLLSLNAAIEAARAGEAGRGFAVVADEISKLADQTAASIKEIDGLIKANVEEIGRGMKNVQETVSTIMTIIEGVNAIGGEINDITRQMENQKELNRRVIERADSVMVMSDEMKNAIDDQKNSMNEIVKSISNLNEITQVYAEGARKLTADSHGLEELVGELLVRARSEKE